MDKLHFDVQKSVYISDYTVYCVLCLAFTCAWKLYSENVNGLLKSKPGFKDLPGPQWFPIVGNLPQIAHISWSKVYFSLYQLSKKYGGIMKMYFGPRKVLVLSDPHVIHELMRHDEWSYRSGDAFAKMRGGTAKVLGLIQTDGELWRKTRMFCIKHLKNFGLNTNRIEEYVLKDVQDLTAWLKEKAQNEEILDSEQSFGPSMVSALWRMVTGESVPVQDETVAHLQNIVAETLRNRPIGGGIFWSFPALGRLFPKLSGFEKQARNFGVLRAHMTKIVDEHKVTRTEGEPRDFIDAYLDKLDELDGKDENFSEEQLVMTTVDLFVAGSDTTSSTFRWALLFLLTYPDIQQKLQNELDTVPVDEGESIMLKDHLPYMDAFLMEVNRCASLAPIVTPHAVAKSTDLYGHVIPQGTLVFMNMWGIHHDKDHWGDPEIFRPERFFSSDGKLTDIHEKWLNPFGSGKRRCPGEALAKSVLFLSIANILKKFTISRADEHFQPSLEPINGLSLSPQPYKMKITMR